MRFLEKQQLIIVGVAAMLFIGFAVFRYYPLTRQKRRIEKTNTEQIVAVTKAKTCSLQLPFLRRHITAIREKTEDYEVKIPKNRQFAELWRQFASVMNKHNLKGQLVQPGTEIQGSEVSRIPMTIECTGSLNQIFELFRSLQDFERLIRIEDMKLINGKDFAGPLKMEVQASVYYRSAEEKHI